MQVDLSPLRRADTDYVAQDPAHPERNFRLNVCGPLAQPYV
jgi:hypothetical protein